MTRLGRVLGMSALVGFGGWLGAAGAQDVPLLGEPGDIDAVAALAAAAGGVSLGTAEAVVNQSMSGNRLVQDGAIQRTAIDASFGANSGITSVNQDAGNFNNQANVRVVTISNSASASTVLEFGGSAIAAGNLVHSSGGARSDTIHASFGGGRGIVGVNQSAGNLNQQANVALLTFGQQATPEGLVLLSDAALAGESGDAQNEAGPLDQSRRESITDSFDGFRGIAQVTQSSGDLNRISTRFGMSINAGVAP